VAAPLLLLDAADLDVYLHYHVRQAGVPAIATTHTDHACLPLSFPSQRLYGSAEGLLAAQRNPTTPLDRVLHHGKEAAARVAYLNSLKEEHKGNPYMDYALTREGEFHADPANIAHEELLLPKVGGLLYVCVGGGGGEGGRVGFSLPVGRWLRIWQEGGGAEANSGTVCGGFGRTCSAQAHTCSGSGTRPLLA
jgi:hypothetical protein